MRLKDLFTVPTGHNVTEKHLHRVLISSICSILLCMTCLVSTTWAWFAVSIENTGNVIQIATVTADVNFMDSAEGTVAEISDNCYKLQAGTYAIEVKVENDATDWRRPVYVLMSMASGEEHDYYYFSFEPNSNVPQRIEFSCSEIVTVSFSVSWLEPVSALSIGDGAVVTDETRTESATEPSTKPEAAATEPSAETTTIPATEAITAPTTESTPAPAAEETTIPSATDSTIVPATTPAVIPTESVAEPEVTTVPTETG